MSDDEPQPSSNPFIKFKRHVDSRIGSGLSVLTGTSSRTDPATAAPSHSRDNMDKAPSSPASTPWSAGSPSFSCLKEVREHTSSIQYWYEWALTSHYSPYNLRHLPNPVPAGVSSKDASLFDFGDAFEDLLAVSSGRDLMDLRKQAERKRSMFDLFPAGEPFIHWVSYLSSKKLLPQPLPPHHQSDMGPQMATAESRWGRHDHGSEILKAIEALRQRPKFPENQGSAFEDHEPACEKRQVDLASLLERWVMDPEKDITFDPDTVLRHFEEIRKSVDEWNHVPGYQWKMLAEIDKDRIINFARMITEAEQTMRRLQNFSESSGLVKPRTLEAFGHKAQDNSKEDFDFDAYFSDTGKWATTTKQNTQNRREAETEPDTEEDFFITVADAVAEVSEFFDSAFTGLEKFLSTKRFARNSHEDEVMRSNQPAEVVERNQDGGQTHTTVSEYSDAFGHVHSKTEVRKVDANGNTIGYETKYVIRPASAVVTELRKSKGELENESKSCSQDGKNDTSTVDNGKSTGWFWR
ncbi:hypothetical protein N0V82_001407 [Gnomoniopsis sp. IMI 355080]|nr:hypothetical protein N0V82_001407 [Gnomoniopsis sp. IMI 355080]